MTNQYIDGFLIPVPTDNIESYQRAAAKAAAIWKEHGALEYRECVGDNLEVEGMISFAKVADAKLHETVIFAYVVYPSKEARDAANAKIMADPRIIKMSEEVQKIFDCSRMTFGGFQTLVYQ